MTKQNKLMFVTVLRYGKMMKSDVNVMHSELLFIIKSYNEEDHIKELTERIETLLRHGKSKLKMPLVLDFIEATKMQDCEIEFNKIDFITLNSKFYEKVNDLMLTLSKTMGSTFCFGNISNENTRARDFVFYLSNIVKIKLILEALDQAETTDHQCLLFYALGRVDASLSEYDNFISGGKSKSVNGSKKATSTRDELHRIIVAFLKHKQIPFYIGSTTTGKPLKNYKGIFRCLSKTTAELENFSNRKLNASVSELKEITIKALNTKLVLKIKPTGSQLNQKLAFIFSESYSDEI